MFRNVGQMSNQKEGLSSYLASFFYLPMDNISLPDIIVFCVADRDVISSKTNAVNVLCTHFTIYILFNYLISSLGNHALTWTLRKHSFS